MAENEKAVVPITDRTFEFSLRIVKLCREIGREPVNRVLGTQLLRSSTSVGANMEEAQAAQSKPDFVSKTSIALKEARESHYWLRLLAATDAKLTNRLAPLVQESREIRDILGAICIKAAQKPEVSDFFFLHFSFYIFHYDFRHPRRRTTRPHVGPRRPPARTFVPHSRTRRRVSSVRRRLSPAWRIRGLPIPLFLLPGARCRHL